MQTFTRKDDGIEAVKIETINGLTLNGDIELSPAFVSHNTFRIGDYVSFFNGRAQRVWPAAYFNSLFNVPVEEVDEEETWPLSATDPLSGMPKGDEGVSGSSEESEMQSEAEAAEFAAGDADLDLDDDADKTGVYLGFDEDESDADLDAELGQGD